MSKIAVVLFNLGGPDSRGAIKPFLMNFFMDKNIIGAPIPFAALLPRISAARGQRRKLLIVMGFWATSLPCLKIRGRRGKRWRGF